MRKRALGHPPCSSCVSSASSRSIFTPTHVTKTDRRSFCPFCGARFDRALPGPHLQCNQCHEIYYRNPAVGVAVVVLEGSRILLGRRGRGVKAGEWCIPCGYVEWDEDVRDGARREVREETGLEVDLGEVYAVHSNFHDREKQTVGIWFLAKGYRGELAAGDDIVEVGFFALHQLPRLAFPTDEQVIESLRASLG